MCWTWGREGGAGVRKPGERMREWREARAVAHLQFRASEKIVNTSFDLMVLRKRSAGRIAGDKRTLTRRSTQVG